ncbi:phage tail tape measure protein [Paenibacillus tianjinensis]|uniref:Phage tail tape measure protein n=1 Tax=Paenibacillus tianjinensis TaxID=2810347 RepID=A0ABX7L5C5_9BACL|nr:phage tail tape measure protein [Paenibacillus tianjinensis]QSF43265.1 phage tail tape measure protein [Paenibacillus tianjinensis]
MANNETLGIKLVASLNTGLSIGELNKGIAALSKHPSLQKLKINISIDENFIKNLSSFTKNLNIITQQLNQQSAANNRLNSGLSNTTQIIHDQTKATNEAIAAEKKWQVEREKTNSKGVTTTTSGNNLNNSKQVVTTLADGSIKNIDNINNQLKDAKELQSFIDQMATGRIASETRVRDFERQWNNEQQKAIQTNANIEREEIAKTQQNRKAYEDWYLKAIREREIQDSKTYNSLNSKVLSSKSSSVVGIEDTKALELLNRKYAEVNQRVATLQASGRQLTESELNGINRRIKALNDLASRQKQAEKDRASLSAIQLRTEAQVNNLTAKYGANIDTTKLNTLLTQLKNLEITSTNFRGKTQQITSEINRMGAEARNASQHVHTMGEMFKTALSHVMMYAGIGSIFFGAINALKQMTNTIIEVDTQMSQLYRVMNSDTDFEGMLERNIELADQLSTSLTSVNEVAIEFGRMGFGDAQIASLTKSAVLAQTISELSAKESVDAIVAGMVNFNIAAADSISIVDQLNNVDNNFSTTSKDLALTLTKSGSAAYTFGRSLQGLIGDSTAVSEATRETGSVTGNFLKSLYSRLTTMDKSESLLAQAGVAMRDLNGEVKDADQLIPELAANWSKLSEETKRNVSVGLAGRNHLNRFSALMSNFSTSVNASEVALNSQGSAMRESEKRAGSLEARIEKMKVAWQTFSVSMGESVVADVIKLVTALLVTLGKTFTSLIDTFGGLPVVFGTLSTILFITSGRFRLMASSMTMAIGRLVGIVPASTAAAGGLRGMAAAANVAKISLQGLLASTIVGVVLVGIGYGLEWLIGKFGDTTEEVDSLTNSMEDLNQKSTDLSTLKKLSSQYEELTKKVKLTTDEKMKLAEVETNLKDNYGITLKTIEGQTGTLEDNTEAIKKRTAALQEEIKTMRESAILDYQSQETKINSDIEDEGKKVDELRKKYEDAQRQKDTFELNRSKGKYSDQYSEKELNDSGEDLAEALKNAKTAFDRADTDLQKDVNKKATALKNSFAIYIGGLKDSGTEISSQASEFADAYADIMSKTPQNSGAIFGDFKKALDVFKTSNVKNLDEAIALFEKLPGITELNGQQLKDLKDILSQYDLTPVFEDTEGALSDTEDEVLSLSDAFKLLDSAMSGSTESTDAFYKSLSNGKSEIELLNSAQEELAKNGYLSIETMGKLAGTFDDFSGHIGDTKESLIKYMGVQEQDRINAINAQKDKTDKLIKATELRIAAMETEMQTINKLQNTYGAAVDSGAMSDLEAERRLGTRRKESNAQSVQAEKATLNKLRDQAALLEYASTDYKSSANGNSGSDKDSSSKDKSEKDKDLAEFKDATEQRINAINAQADAQSELNNLYKDKSSSYESDKNYSAAIEQTTNLIKGQKLETTKLQQANTKLIAARDEVQAKSKQYNMLSWIDTNGEATTSFTNLYNSMKSKTAQDALQTQFDQFQMYTKAIRENKTAITDNIAAQKESQGTLDNQRLENTNVWLGKMSKSYTDLQEKVSDSKDVQSLLNEDSVEYREETERQVSAYKELMKSIESDNEAIRTRIKQSETANASDKLTTDQLSVLNDQLKSNNDTWYDAARSIKEANKSLDDFKSNSADTIIENYKKMIEKQKELALDAIDTEKQAEEERHNARKKNLENEYAAFEKVINAQLDALNEKEATDDYSAELNDKLADRAALQTRLDSLSKDDSIEGKAKAKELQEQINEQTEEIEKFKLDRERTLRKDNLSQQLEDKESSIDAEQDAEDAAYDATSAALDKAAKEKEQYYTDILEDERSYYLLKQQLLSNDSVVVESALATMGTKYKEFFDTLKTQIGETSKEYQNLLYSFSQDSSGLTNYSNLSGTGSTTNPVDSPASSSSSSAAKQAAWTQYLSNKQQAESIRAQMALLDKKSTQYASLESQFNNLAAQNTAYRNQYGFPDGSYEKLKNTVFSAETGGMTPAFSGGKFLLAHEKELVLDKFDTSKLLQIVNVARDIYAMRSGANNLDTSGLTAAVQNKNATTTGDTYQEFKFDFNIDKMDGGEAGAKKIFSFIQQQMKRTNGGL